MNKEFIIRFYQRYRLYIFPFIVAVSSLILIIFVLLPQISSILSGQKSEKDLLSKASVLDVKAEELEGYDSSDLSQKVSYALSAFPSEKDFGNVIGLIQGLTSSVGFNVTSIQLGSSGGKTSNAQSYSVAVSLSGPKNLISTLFSTIEASPRLMKVSLIDITTNVSGESVDISLNIDVLYSPVPNNFGSVDSPLPKLSSDDEELLAKLASNPAFAASVATVSNTSPDNIQLPPRGKANPFE